MGKITPQKPTFDLEVATREELQLSAALKLLFHLQMTVKLTKIFGGWKWQDLREGILRRRISVSQSDTVSGKARSRYG